ncbi:hypothetical protein NDU88_011696 [Pleurodeles waltl]|uniref:Uncharacterized protein n=1 Tax=Pleurodeles waltl TaxID=8319 RepID=A0AAV7QY29_PLEWA|nr:hypothetical protein NDU88_011696 [Pleurodeles waltl]
MHIFSYIGPDSPRRRVAAYQHTGEQELGKTSGADRRKSENVLEEVLDPSGLYVESLEVRKEERLGPGGLRASSLTRASSRKDMIDGEETRCAR